MKVIHILLIEDDSIDREDVLRNLRKRNILYRLSVAENGHDARDMMVAGLDDPSLVPDIILLDLDLPLMNGMELLEEIKKNQLCQEAKIFVLAGAIRPDTRARFHKLGVSGCITKPLRFDSPTSLDSFNLMIDLLNGSSME